MGIGLGKLQQVGKHTIDQLVTGASLTPPFERAVSVLEYNFVILNSPPKIRPASGSVEDFVNCGVSRA